MNDAKKSFHDLKTSKIQAAINAQRQIHLDAFKSGGGFIADSYR